MIDLTVDANVVIARLSAQIAAQVQTITIQQLQIEKLQAALAESTPTVESNGNVPMKAGR